MTRPKGANRKKVCAFCFVHFAKKVMPMANEELEKLKRLPQSEMPHRLHKSRYAGEVFTRAGLADG